MSPYSILQNVRPGDIRREPYPHIVIPRCLPDDLYTELARTYPDDALILQLDGSAKRGQTRPNSRHDLAAHGILSNPGLFSKAWLEFTAYHVSRTFFEEVVALMGPEIRTAHPGLETRLDCPLDALTTGLRGDRADSHIALDCHIGINTPAVHKGSVRRVHADAPDELFAALFYFRQEDDRAAGGDLEIFRWKPGRTLLFVGSEVDEADAEHVATIPYQPNTAVIFINSEHALHAVSPRDPSSTSRRLVNIMGRVPHSIPEGLFKKRQKLGATALARRAVLRYRIATNRF